MDNAISLEQALQVIMENNQEGPVVYKNLSEGVDECLAESVYADRDLPPFNRAAMDGYALKKSDLPGRGKPIKVSGTVYAGMENETTPRPGEAVKIMAGAAVPTPLDTVIRFEDSEVQGEGNEVVFHVDKVEAWQNIARKGQDARKDNVVIEKGTILTNTAMGIAASVGHTPVQVFPKPTVAILATGDEIIPVEQVAREFQVRNSNSFALYSLLYYLKIEPIFHTIASAEKEELVRAMQKGLQADIFVVTGGFAKGEAEMIPETLKELGVQELIHGIRIKPGRPVWFGKTENGHAVFGLPGNPVSVQLTFKAYVEQYIRRSMGQPPLEPLYLPLKGSHSKGENRAEFVIGRISQQDGQSKVEEVPYHGSGDYVNIQGSHGFFIHWEQDGTLKDGNIVEFYTWKSFS